MDRDERRDDLLERAYRRGYELRVRRRRLTAMLAALVVITVASGAAVAASHNGNSRVSVSKKPTPPAPVSCAASVAVVPSARVPHAVAAWSGGRPVIGGGALWTIRSAIDVVPNRQPAGWLLKFPWYTTPFGLPTITGHRLDGAGTFRADANAATDSRGTWVVSSLQFSGPGCWQVTGRYRTSTIRFRIRVRNETRPSTTTPSEIAVLQAEGGHVSVMSTATGKVVRVLAQSQGLIRYDPTLAVTPDGATVYFSTSRRPTAAECSVGLVDEVVFVPVRGGPVTAVGPGVFPAVSPNGRFLAYTRNAAGACNSDHDEVLVLDLRTGARRTFASASHVDVAFLSWAPDSVHLSYEQSVSGASSTELLDTSSARTLDDATPIRPVDSDWGGFLGTTGAGIGVTPHNGSGESSATVVRLDPATGARTRTLFVVPGGLAVGNVADGPEDALHADRSGKEVLALGLLPIGATTRHGALYRWHDGDAKPVLVADNVWAAAWIEPNAATATASASP